MAFHLAQVNIAYSRAPQDDPLLADFVAQLDAINQLADVSPGFVWRYLSDSRDPAQREFSDPRVLFNMSVWDSLEALHAFTYRSNHGKVFAARKKWPLENAHVTLRHAKIHAEDCAECETKTGMLDRIERVVRLDGPLDAEQKARLMEIADKCPVHRTLESEIHIVTSAAD